MGVAVPSVHVFDHLKHKTTFGILRLLITTCLLLLEVVS